jgi:hypothetical protein
MRNGEQKPFGQKQAIALPATWCCVVMLQCCASKADRHPKTIPEDEQWCFLQVHKGYHMQMRKFVAVKRVNSTNKVGIHPQQILHGAVRPARRRILHGMAFGYCYMLLAVMWQWHYIYTAGTHPTVACPSDVVAVSCRRCASRCCGTSKSCQMRRTSQAYCHSSEPM